MFQEAHDYNHKLIFGLIHLRPMPGTPFYKDGDSEASIEKAIKDAKALENGGASGCLIQTVDKVYPNGYEKEALLKRVHEASMVKAGAVEIMSKDETLNNQMAEDIRKAFPHMPIILGGGTDVESVKRRLQFADGALVGSCFEGNKWGEGIQESIVADYMREVHSM